MKEILVFGDKTFKLRVPDDSKITFGPFSPPPKRFDGRGWEDGAKAGTLRIYDHDKNVLAVFAGVRGFRDLSLGYAEEVAREEGAVIWKDDEQGYQREDKVQRRREWVTPALPPAVNEGRKRKK